MSHDSVYANGSCVVKHFVGWLLFFWYGCVSCGWEMLDVDINVLSNVDSIEYTDIYIQHLSVLYECSHKVIYFLGFGNVSMMNR